ncbi:reverse transcriptase [Gossypium australe]|uniref:Reverse transcriptase n=1 Tax=Gossypium australe TaxID=47621 RepID=A0A5B6WPV5_9ROSI|nr:reverse transcriptase [Gossypium australe]
MFSDHDVQHLNIDCVNSTTIVLIPMIKNSRNMSHFKPISLFLTVLNVCINEAQSAFVPGKMIIDNVLIAYEMFHALKKKKARKKGSIALKLDMSKAYDGVE